MASEWYVQHGGKEYGPMSPGNLKKLAAERKITPATSVRLGATGTWVPASKVQGLFGAAAPAGAPATAAAPNPLAPPAIKAPAAQSAPPKAAPAPLPKAQPLAAPPKATPLPPPVASGMAPPPWARPAAQAAPTESAAMAPKVLGAVAIIFGAVALATFWLPMLKGPIGWTGIVVGGLGMVVGIVGLVVAAMTKGAGLILNVAGTSSAAVGLVLSVVLGVTFGLFGAGPAPQVTAKPTLPPIALPTPEPAAQPEPEPEAPPEPVWTDAGESIEQGPIKATVASVGIEQVRLESTDLSTLRRQKPQPMLKVRVTIENTSNDKIVEVPGWVGGSDLIGQGVGQLLGGEVGQAVQTATATAKLTDNAGNPYKQTPAMSLFGAKIEFGADHAVRPGKSRQVELVFPPPLETAEYLRLELSAAGFSGSDSLRFQIPRAMITGMPAPAGG